MADSSDSASIRSTPAPVSCDFCREKKYRCSKEKPSCQRCLNAGRKCHYSPAQARTPLTRLYVTSVENRVKSLERLLHKLHPEMNIEDALLSVDDIPVSSPVSTTNESPEQTSADVVQSEALPLAATGFEWQEVNPLMDGLADGMASLSVDPAGKGYLGSTSGAGLLRSLLSQNNFNAATQSSSRTRQDVHPFNSSQMLMSAQVGEQLLNHQIISYLIDSYFANYHTSYPFIHEPSFRAAYSELLPRPSGSVWHILFYTVLTLGAWTVGDDNEVFDDYCYHKAVSYFQEQSVFELGSLPLVQSLVLLSNYVQKRNKPNTGSNYLGLAVRQSLSLGLHRELAGWKIGLLEREMRRRVWWGLFIFDSGAATTFGRDILLPEDIDVKPVLNIPDESLTPSTTILPMESNVPTIYSNLIHQSTFHRLTNSMANRLLSTNPPSTNEALRMYTAIQAWKKALPYFFDIEQPPAASMDWYLFARSKLAWRTWNFQLLIMRPFLLRWAKRQSRDTTAEDGTEEKRCREICIESANLTIASIQQYVSTNTLPRLHAWYALFFLFHAALVPMLCLRASPASPDAGKWIQDIGTVKFLLETSFTTYSLAQRCLDVINQVLPSGTSSDWSPTQLDLSFTDPNLESWFEWPEINSNAALSTFGPLG
ncbi:uncharacterized protein PV09_07197 [Verruconis gallopava]|uniref:Zn(2)-C6 fungal-type domain-containing protein n=1 Tax=Verruconis gallopava TaxID=253628 RepID=A0A0D2AQL1_9PEZI|nr:uncharacterized protein PV09_07197 [Verruconis gallopava]KIW01439.1 hypothetical protein PV09_07197 [Verruconis gallopava]